MLLSAVIQLTVAEPTTAPAILGREAHAWFLRRIADGNAPLARRLHEGDGPRPFTVSDLWGKGRAQDGQVRLDPERSCWLRLTGLTEEMSAALERALPKAGETLALGETSFVVSATLADADQHPWAGRATYVSLVQEHTLSPGAPPRAVTLRFASPTLFRSAGRDLPLPQPDLVLGGYLRKWNAFSPIQLPEEAARYAQECVALGRFRLRSHLVSFEGAGKGAHVGFTGEVRFRFLVGDGYWTRLMRLLAAYAFWCGTGYRTSAGLGQTQPLSSGGERSLAQGTPAGEEGAGQSAQR